MKIDQDVINSFQKIILDWYKENQRDLPWRKTREPYHIMVSEIMLQQTQVNRVITKFEEWLKRFPTVEDLAKAPVADVLQYWSGLGYNRRALNLKRAAEKIVTEHNGKFPKDEMTLLALPGIGAYTSRAILCFAFDKQVAVVDTNVKKIILTQILKQQYPKQELPLFVSLNDAPKKTEEYKPLSEKEFQEIAEQLLPHGHAYDWNQALMDYASHVLKKEKIPIPKQSKFEGSRRQSRGKLLKLLLEKKSVARDEIGPAIKKDYSGNDTAWLQKLLDELQNEGFIEIKNEYILLRS